MSNKIVLKKSSVGAKVPLTTDLAYGELALNYADGKLYFKNSSNTIQFLGSSSATETLTNKTLTSPSLTTPSITGLTSISVTTSNNALNVTYEPSLGTGAAAFLTGKDSQGGVGYFDFLKVTNTTSGVTNGSKSFRLNSTGGIEVVNSAYTAIILELTDSGVFKVPQISAGGSVGTSGQVLSSTGSGLQWITATGTGTVTSVVAGTGLSGGTITVSGTISLAASGVTAGSYGSSTAVPVLTIDTYGRVTSVSTASITTTLGIAADSGTDTISLASDTLTFVGGTGIDSVINSAANTVTFNIDSTVATLTGTQTLTNKTLTSPVISTIVNTGTITLPTSTDTLVGRDTTDTLTNKTLTSPSITTLTYAGTTLSNSVTGTGSMVLSASPTFTGTANFAALSTTGNVTVGGSLTIQGGVSTVDTIAYDYNFTGTTSSTTATAMTSFATATYRSGKLLMQVVNGAAYRILELLIVHDGTTVTLSENYAVATEIQTGATSTTFSASIASGTLTVYATASTGTAVIKGHATLFKV